MLNCSVQTGAGRILVCFFGLFITRGEYLQRDDFGTLQAFVETEAWHECAAINALTSTSIHVAVVSAQLNHELKG